jgi:hypothetical protein
MKTASKTISGLFSSKPYWDSTFWRVFRFLVGIVMFVYGRLLMNRSDMEVLPWIMVLGGLLLAASARFQHRKTL